MRLTGRKEGVREELWRTEGRERKGECVNKKQKGENDMQYEISRKLDRKEGRTVENDGLQEEETQEREVTKNRK